MSSSRLVLLHPWGNDASCWTVDPDMARFAAWRQAEMPALPADAAAAQRAFAESIAAAEGAIDLMAIGDSCAIALTALSDSSARIRSAMLVNPCDGMSLLEAGAIRPDVLERWFTPFGRRSGQAGVRYVEALAGAHPEMFAKGPKLPATHVLRGIAQPVSVVIGTGTESKAATAIHNSIAMSRIELVPGRGFTHLEFPDALMSAIYHHLTWARAPQRLVRPLLFSPLGSMGEWHEERAS